jgi:hypothetical protein
MCRLFFFPLQFHYRKDYRFPSTLQTKNWREPHYSLKTFMPSVFYYMILLSKYFPLLGIHGWIYRPFAFSVNETVFFR